MFFIVFQASVAFKEIFQELHILEKENIKSKGLTIKFSSMIHFTNFPQIPILLFKNCANCETVYVLNYTIMYLEEIFSIIQATNNPCSTMTESQLAYLEILVLNTSQSKSLVMKTIIYKIFTGKISWIQNNMKPWGDKKNLLVICVAS